jgi:hypothetical protein
MKIKWIIIGVAAVCALLAGTGTAAITYNPIKWIKKTPGPTASEQLAANKQEEKKLSVQLQAVLLAQASRMRARDSRASTIALPRFTQATISRSNSTALNGM